MTACNQTTNQLADSFIRDVHDGIVNAAVLKMGAAPRQSGA